MLITIYQLVHPVTDYPFYVGQTARTLEQRLSHHIQRALAHRGRRSCAKTRVIREILKSGQRPIIRALGVAENRILAGNLESRWIAKLKNEGRHITNTYDPATRSTINCSIILDDDTRSALEAFCGSTGLTRLAAIRLAIKEFFAKEVICQ